MKQPPVIRFALIGLLSVCVYLCLGLLLFAGVIHTGPHDWFQLPGVTIEHYYGHGLIVEDVRPVVLLPALAISYAITWYLFRWASGWGKKVI